MPHLGEVISLIVAIFWTVTALFADKASHRLGSMSANVLRLSLAVVFLGLLLWVSIGTPFPVHASGKAWLWLGLSALVGYLFGDWCLFNCYLSIGARFGQLFMTLAPPMAAVAGWAILGETLSWRSLFAMGITLCGIAISILSRDSGHKVHLTLPLKGVLLGLGAGMGQGVGLVLSKVGMTHYETLITTPEALDIMPFSSTFIRAVTGFVGFSLVMFFTGKARKVYAVTHDRRGMTFALIATLTGPFLGVSLSLMATLYTSTGIAQTIMAMTPIFILLPSWYFFKQKVTPLEILGAIISVGGVALFFV